MTVNKVQDGNKLTVCVEGKLNAVTSPVFESELGDLTGVEELIFDLKDLEYTSSAGLRVLLSAQKIMDDQGRMVIKNVNSDVMNIFKETGFHKIFEIE